MKINLEGYMAAFLLLVGPCSVGSKRTIKQTTELFKLGEGSVMMGNRDVQDEFEGQVALPEDLTKTATLSYVIELAKHVEEMEERVDKLEDLAKVGTLRSCAEYTKHGLKKSGLYMIDPDGALQGQEPFQAYCDFNAGATEVFHDTESSTEVEHCRLPGCYNKSITYINGQDQSPISLSQITSLMELAEYCTQEIRFDCTLAPLNNNDVSNGYWFDRHGEKNIYFTGSNYGDHVCDCHYDDGGCIDQKTWGNRCNCDANIPVRSSDKGTITNMTALPISNIFFGGLKYDMQFAAFTLGRLKCYGERDVDLATSCSALKRKGILQSGYYHIKTANDVHASLVFCDMQSPTYSDVPQQNQPSKDSPIGTIIAWIRKPEEDLSSVSSLPNGWVPCNGSTITDGPWTGGRTPDLNGGHFLRGGSEEEMLMLENDQIEDHTHIDKGHGHSASSTAAPHSHGYLDYYVSTSNPDTYCVAGCKGQYAKNDQVGSLSRYKSRTTSKGTVSVSTSVSNTNSGLSGVSSHYRAGTETRPRNMRVQWVMRCW